MWIREFTWSIKSYFLWKKNEKIFKNVVCWSPEWDNQQIWLFLADSCFFLPHKRLLIRIQWEQVSCPSEHTHKTELNLKTLHKVYDTNKDNGNCTRKVVSLSCYCWQYETKMDTCALAFFLNPRFFGKLENVFVKHYAPNHMPDPKGEWSLKENNSELHYRICSKVNQFIYTLVCNYMQNIRILAKAVLQIFCSQGCSYTKCLCPENRSNSTENLWNRFKS